MECVELKDKKCMSMVFWTINLIQKRILLNLAIEDKFAKSKKCVSSWLTDLQGLGMCSEHVPHKEHTCFLVKHRFKILHQETASKAMIFTIFLQYGQGPIRIQIYKQNKEKISHKILKILNYNIKDYQTTCLSYNTLLIKKYRLIFSEH